MISGMKTSLSALLLAGTAFTLGVVLSPVTLTPVDAAGQGEGQGQRGQGGDQAGPAGRGGGGQGGTTINSRIFRGKGERVIIILEDDDSDRPAWAGGNPQLNPHAKAGGGKPAGAGSKKGDLYGDLIMFLRDPVTGEPIVVDGENLICLDPACTTTTPTVDGEVPEGVVPIEVEFGRASIARAPDSVIDKALADALEKLSADGVVIGTDTAGRITYTYPSDVDGDGTIEPGETLTSAINSPLENLALYIDLSTGLVSDEVTSVTEALLGTLATLDTAASLFAGVADKTGTISLDYLVYQNVITGIVAPDTYYDYTSLNYTRDYLTDYTYWVSIDGADPVSKTLDINAYLEAINGTLPAQTNSAALFAAAADDALEVIELVHTQIYTELLPGTIE